MKQPDPLGGDSYEFIVGRPTKYDPKFCAMIVQHSKNLGGTIGSFAAMICVDHSTILEWGKKHPDFSLAIRVAKQKQLEVMSKLGLSGMLGKNGSGSWQAAYIFMMKARFGLREDGPVDVEDVELEFNLEDKEE
jgi:hypothetical protein